MLRSPCHTITRQTKNITVADIIKAPTVKQPARPRTTTQDHGMHSKTTKEVGPVRPLAVSTKINRKLIIENTM